MPFREVSMLEVKEVIRLLLKGMPKKQIARLVGLDPKTVRRYALAAAQCGAVPGVELTDELVSTVFVWLNAQNARDHGESWGRCEDERAFIKKSLKEGVRLTKVRRLLLRRGVVIPYPTLHRFAKQELAFGKKAPTVPVLDGKPGQELQVDTGWVLSLLKNQEGVCRRMRAWIFTPVVSRYRFVFPCERETTASAIEACEAAAIFYEGFFEVLIPDNTKAIVSRADPLDPLIVVVFLEYAQARGFVIDTARVRKPKDKARVERAVRDVRDDCFGGENIATLQQARARGHYWSESEYGMRPHSTTGRLPKEHFLAVERPYLLPPPVEPYDVPSWSSPLVGRDHFASALKALYTLPTRFIGLRLRCRVDAALVRFYDKGVLVKTHPRKEPYGKSIDVSDFPPEKTPYAMRDINFLKREAEKHGAAVGSYAVALLAVPLPWTSMRRVYALLRLATKYGAARVDDACQQALIAQMVDVKRLARMLEQAAAPASSPAPAPIVPPSRFLKPAAQYALPFPQGAVHDDDERPDLP